MGLFGKLFEKKICSVCGREIKFLGNRKLEDGNLCRDCEKKLSPWFDGRRHASAEEIRRQLHSREENRALVAAFRTTHSLGRSTRLLLDEDAMRFMITDARDLDAANPDVLSFSQITGCDIDIRESRREETRTVKDKEGHSHSESYDPPHIIYTYHFYVEVRVDAPYFDTMRFPVNSGVEIRPWESGRLYRNGIPAGARMLDAAYRETDRLAREIKRALDAARERARDQAAAAARPREAVLCPFCGASTVPDENNRCEYCGSALG
ncbi:MAG: DUF4428 domain-containing protein [Oscillospiraceae bacterium]|nr:DUF4428 domain-containing protein [Oscillospiraceae bacterium]